MHRMLRWGLGWTGCLVGLMAPVVMAQAMEQDTTLPTGASLETRSLGFEGMPDQWLRSRLQILPLMDPRLRPASLSVPEPLRQLELVLTPSSTSAEQDFSTDEIDGATASRVTSETLSQVQPTRPSFWWIQSQIGNRLIENWVAENGMVDLVVNPQVWSLLTYSEKYGFINQFATTAQQYGYNVRVFDRRSVLLATHICDLTAVPTADPSACAVCLDGRGSCEWRVGFTALDALRAKGSGTAPH